MSGRTREEKSRDLTLANRAGFNTGVIISAFYAEEKLRELGVEEDRIRKVVEYLQSFKKPTKETHDEHRR